MIFRMETTSYNERRYGKPWIAKLDFSKPGQPVYVFGEWLGQSGDPGELSIEVSPGDVIAHGQKDNRKGRGGASDFGVILIDGSGEWGYTPAKARDAGEVIRNADAAQSGNEFDPIAMGM